MFPPTRTWSRAVLAAAGAALALAGCAAPGPADGRFDAGTAAYPMSCLAHQADRPGPTYTGGAAGDTAAIFAMLKYYTGNKAVTAYCDGKPATDTDRRWARLYVDLGADPANVTHILG